MSEKIYAWLLRLYPSNFQEAYREEALQLFRDRAQNESGFLSRLRLWLDLLSDLAVSVPIWHHAVPAARIGAPATHRSNGVPAFHSLENEALSFGSLFYGGIVSLVAYGSVLLLISHGGNTLPLPARSIQQSPRYSGAIANPFTAPASDAGRPLGYSGTTAKPRPTVTLSYLPANLSPRSSVSLTATVLAVDAGPTPTGNVRFLDGSALLATGKLNNGAVTVKGTLPGVTTHSLIVIYDGDANYSPASAIAKSEGN